MTTIIWTSPCHLDTHRGMPFTYIWFPQTVISWKIPWVMKAVTPNPNPLPTGFLFPWNLYLSVPQKQYTIFGSVFFLWAKAQSYHGLEHSIVPPGSWIWFSMYVPRPFYASCHAIIDGDFLLLFWVRGEVYLNCAVGAMLKLELQPNRRARSSPGVKAQTSNALRLVWSLVPHGLLSIAGCSHKGPQSLCGWSPKYVEPKGLISIILLDSWLEPQNWLLVA